MAGSITDVSINQYSGHGDVKDGANWSCPTSDMRMLKVGESGRQAGMLD